MHAMIKLQIFVTKNCWSCDETRRIVAELAPEFPDVTMELLDLENASPPDNVFAVPTYLLNGRVISLGNPYRADLRQTLQQERQRPEM